MHEISLIRSVFNTIEAEFSKEEIDDLEEIRLRIGLLSNIEPLLMQNAFDAVREADHIYPDVTLSIETINITIKCPSCQNISTVINYSFKCDKCGTPSNDILSGTELLIHQLRFKDN